MEENKILDFQSIDDSSTSNTETVNALLKIINKQYDMIYKLVALALETVDRKEETETPDIQSIISALAPHLGGVIGGNKE